MTALGSTHFLDYLFADMRARAEFPLLCEKQGAVFRIATLREVAGRVVDITRSLYAATIGPADRVAFYASANPALLIAEWGVLASKAIAVIVPRSFSPEDLTETLLESKSRLAIVDRLATAYHLAKEALPDLRQIVCLEGGTESSLPIMSWDDFIEAGGREPDRSTALLHSISRKDTVLLFYYKDARGVRQATRYTHALLLNHIARIESILGKSVIRRQELVMTATAWEQPIGHIAACYAPVAREGIVQITHGIAGVALFENGPQVAVGDAAFFDGMREDVLRLVRQFGRIEAAMLTKALSLSKLNYESPNSLRPLMRLQQSALDVTILKKVRGMLGEKMRLFIGTDDEAPYETQLFFHTFGIELIELPREAFKENV